jgi:hypothetical protein
VAEVIRLSYHTKPWIELRWLDRRLPADWSTRKVRRGSWRMNHHPITFRCRGGVIYAAALHNPISGMVEASYVYDGPW